jgi:hypothetical protein
MSVGFDMAAIKPQRWERNKRIQRMLNSGKWQTYSQVPLTLRAKSWWSQISNHQRRANSAPCATEWRSRRLLQVLARCLNE